VWRHALQDLEPVIGFANLRPKHPSEFEEAIAHLAAQRVPGEKRFHSPVSITFLRTLGGTALKSVRLAGLSLNDPNQEPWQRKNAQKRACQWLSSLRGCTARILDRLQRGNALVVNGIERPELDPKTQRIDFVVNGRQPNDEFIMGPAPRGPVFRLHTVDDIQDAMFLKIRDLIDRVQRPTRLRAEDGRIIPFWPLAYCLVCGHFYFKSRSDRTTCSRRCIQRWDHIARQRTVRDLKTGKYLRQHDLQVTVTAGRIRK